MLTRAIFFDSAPRTLVQVISDVLHRYTVHRPVILRTGPATWIACRIEQSAILRPRPSDIGAGPAFRAPQLHESQRTRSVRITHLRFVRDEVSACLFDFRGYLAVISQHVQCPAQSVVKRCPCWRARWRRNRPNQSQRSHPHSSCKAKSKPSLYPIW